MGCVSKTLAGIVADCSTSMGGIKKIWLTTTDPKPSVSAGVITAFAGSGVTWYKYEIGKGTSSFTSTLNVDQANGTNYVSTELVMLFKRMDAVKRAEMEALSLDDMYAVVLDANGVAWYLGFDEPISATAGTGQTGTAKTDANNYQITLTDESATFPYTVAEDIIPTV